MKKAELHIFKTPEIMANQFADLMMSWIENHSESSFNLAISGGKTPDLLFSVLVSKYADSSLWQKVHFWWVDERMVAPSDPESNFGVAQKLLFSQISIPEENIHRIKGENAPEAEAFSYSAQIQENIPQQNGWPIFDLILLGMGDDGHTASIFPDQMNLLKSNKVGEIATHPLSGQKRITLTGKVINSASKISFLVSGNEKAKRLKEIVNLSPEADLLPAFHIKNASWFVDSEAAQWIE